MKNKKEYITISADSEGEANDQLAYYSNLGFTVKGEPKTTRHSEYLTITILMERDATGTPIKKYSDYVKELKDNTAKKDEFGWLNIGLGILQNIFRK